MRLRCADPSSTGRVLVGTTLLGVVAPGDDMDVDLGLPDMDGIDLIIRLRASLTTPILVASARDARTAKVAALGAGADDYIAKPFGADQFMSRVRAILPRPEPPNGEPLRFSA